MNFAVKWVRVTSAGRVFKRLVVAHINSAGRDFNGNACQSFHPRYRIAETGDYTENQGHIPRSMVADLAHKGIGTDALVWY